MYSLSNGKQGGAAVSEKRLLSVAEIARQLDVPESTLHYWKNRFSQYLPSFGRGRLKRFQPEAVEAFGRIAALLKAGHSSEEVMAELARDYPLNAQAVGAVPAGPAAVAPQLQEVAMDQALRLAAGMGLEMARSLAQGLKEALGGGMAAPALPPEDMGLLKESLSEAAERLSCHSGELETLRTENTELKDKLQILEAELVRLRKDRREMERFLLDKIKGVTT